MTLLRLRALADEGPRLRRHVRQAAAAEEVVGE